MLIDYENRLRANSLYCDDRFFVRAVVACVAMPLAVYAAVFAICRWWSPMWLPAIYIAFSVTTAAAIAIALIAGHRARRWLDARLWGPMLLAIFLTVQTPLLISRGKVHVSYYVYGHPIVCQSGLRPRPGAATRPIAPNPNSIVRITYHA